MNMITPNIEIQTDEETCSIIAPYLQKHDFLEFCHITQNNKYAGITLIHNGNKKTYKCPIRLGALLDQITLYADNKQKSSSRISFIDGSLDIAQGIFINNANKEIFLTEKEVHILSFLHGHEGQIISRGALLRAIWNYADNVETHTLETHIYRLRQKIEANPANPSILITEENGYCVRI